MRSVPGVLVVVVAFAMVACGARNRDTSGPGHEESTPSTESSSSGPRPPPPPVPPYDLARFLGTAAADEPAPVLAPLTPAVLARVASYPNGSTISVREGAAFPPTGMPFVVGTVVHAVTFSSTEPTFATTVVAILAMPVNAALTLDTASRMEREGSIRRFDLDDRRRGSVLVVPGTSGGASIVVVPSPRGRHAMAVLVDRRPDLPSTPATQTYRDSLTQMQALETMGRSLAARLWPPP